MSLLVTERIVDEKVGGSTVRIEPSLLSADPLCLRADIVACEEAGATSLQIDVMDGSFVHNFGFTPSIVKAIHSMTKLELNIHLMINYPEHYIREFADAGATGIAVHQESCFHLAEAIEEIRSLGVSPCVVLNPDTPLSSIDSVVGRVDMIQLMMVPPGFSGQKYIEGKTAKIFRLKQVLMECDIDVPIAVDGGITTETAPVAVLAGASVLIAGKAVFQKDGTIAQNYDALRHSVLKAGG